MKKFNIPHFIYWCSYKREMYFFEVKSASLTRIASFFWFLDDFLCYFYAIREYTHKAYAIKWNISQKEVSVITILIYTL